MAGDKRLPACRAFVFGILILTQACRSVPLDRSFQVGPIPRDAQSVQSVPDLTAFPEPGHCLPTANRDFIFNVHKGTLCAAYVTFQGVLYDIDVACESGVVVWVATRDPKFATPEGVRIGSKITHALDRGAVVMPEKDSLCRLQFPSGWVADVPCESLSGTLTEFQRTLSDAEFENAFDGPTR